MEMWKALSISSGRESGRYGRFGGTRAESAERRGPALVFADVSKKGSAGADTAIMGRDVHKYPLMRIEFPQPHLDFFLRHQGGFQYRLAGGLIGHSHPGKIGRSAVVGAMHLDSELIGWIQRQNIAAKVADAVGLARVTG